MRSKIQVGDHVRLLGIPDWLTHDLPESERIEIDECVGRVAIVYDIDPYGYFWIGFGQTFEVGNSSQYSGHSFGVPREFIEPTTEITIK